MQKENDARRKSKTLTKRTIQRLVSLADTLEAAGQHSASIFIHSYSDTEYNRVRDAFGGWTEYFRGQDHHQYSKLRYKGITVFKPGEL